VIARALGTVVGWGVNLLLVAAGLAAVGGSVGVVLASLLICLPGLILAGAIVFGAWLVL